MMAKETTNTSQSSWDMECEITSIAEKIAARFSSLPQVLAVVLAGSQGSLVSDNLSDLDFYVYIAEEIPVETRAAIAREFAQRFEINNLFWEPGDEWIHTQSGRGIDIMYRSTSWIEEQLDSVLVKHQAKVGYTTCFWFNVLHSMPLFDRMGWFERLLQVARQPYPDPLRKAIVAKNYPILRKNISSYLHQLELAVERHDLASINHRTSALLASYFDIIFAVNSVPHPGEKRLVEFVKTLCQKYPSNFEEQLDSLLKATSVNSGDSDLLDRANALIDSLDEFLIAEGLLTSSGELA
jgi:predicted nucleotidyltransferase